jgi:hypothetical protein|tara:strand:+ start:139 stop:384 length:246 start_codon:yes stop_codon:yes gene_type:complete
MNFVIDVNNTKYVVDAEKLERLTEVLDGCLVFSNEYNRGEDGGESFYTYHAYEQDVESGMQSVQAISSAALAVAKLAGRKK